MRFGHWRGVTLALAVSLASALGSTTIARADLFHTIPRSAPAVDLNTGQPMYAPPVPYGEYAKDYAGCIHGIPGCIACRLRGLVPGGGLCGGCGGKGCGLCGGKGLCGNCGGGGCGLCGGSGGGGFGHGHGHGQCGGGLCGGGFGHGHKHGGGLCAGGACGVGPIGAGAVVIPAAKTLPSSQAPICGNCGGGGCGLCGKGGFGHGHKHGRKACGGCGGAGCGLCARGGLFHGHGGGACGQCGGRGCGLCGGKGGGCRLCGGKGCALCCGLGALPGMGLLHHNRVKYFVGAGGPVPLTPGYVPYVVPTRSPRDYFAFPPFTPELP